MTVSKKQQACVNRYIRSHYTILRFPCFPEDADKIRADASAAGQSVSEYIRQAIRERQERDDRADETSDKD